MYNITHKIMGEALCPEGSRAQWFVLSSQDDQSSTEPRNTVVDDVLEFVLNVWHCGEGIQVKRRLSRLEV
jgi:hypothetical protein